MPGHTDDGRWIVVDGRRWRAQDPALPEDVRVELLHHLGRGRAAVRAARAQDDAEALRAARRRVDLAKHGLGERGQPWWEQDTDARAGRWEAAIDELTDLDPDDAAGAHRQARTRHRARPRQAHRRRVDPVLDRDAPESGAGTP